jgi:hypothetical protein
MRYEFKNNQEVTIMKITGIFLSILVFLICSVIGYGAADETLVLALSFDDGQGNVAKDSSQYRFDGKISGGTKWVDGKFGKALEFDGDQGMVEVADEKELLLLDGGTLMAWVFIKTEKGHASWPRIAIKANTNGGTHGYDFLFDRANNYATRFCIGGVCNSYQPVETENWHHVAVTFDGKNIFVYTDGKEVGKGAQTGPAIDTSGSPLHIGNGVAIDRAFYGILDELRIWSRPLKKDEINWHKEWSSKEIFAVDVYSRTTTTWAEIKRKANL